MYTPDNPVSASTSYMVYCLPRAWILYYNIYLSFIIILISNEIQKYYMSWSGRYFRSLF